MAAAVVAGGSSGGGIGIGIGIGFSFPTKSHLVAAVSNVLIASGLLPVDPLISIICEYLVFIPGRVREINSAHLSRPEDPDRKPNFSGFSRFPPSTGEGGGGESESLIVALATHLYRFWPASDRFDLIDSSEFDSDRVVSVAGPIQRAVVIPRRSGSDAYSVIAFSCSHVLEFDHFQPQPAAASPTGSTHNTPTASGGTLGPFRVMYKPDGERIRWGLVTTSADDIILSTGNALIKLGRFRAAHSVIATADRKTGFDPWAMTFDRSREIDSNPNTKETVLYCTAMYGVFRVDMKSAAAAAATAGASGGAGGASAAVTPIQIATDSMAVDGKTVPPSLDMFGIESLSNGLLIVTSAEDARLWIINPRNGRLTVLVNASSDKRMAVGDALTEAKLLDPSALCLFDGERKLLIASFQCDSLNELTLPTEFDPRLF